MSPTHSQISLQTSYPNDSINNQVQLMSTTTTKNTRTPHTYALLGSTLALSPYLRHSKYPLHTYLSALVTPYFPRILAQENSTKYMSKLRIYIKTANSLYCTLHLVVLNMSKHQHLYNLSLSLITSTTIASV